MSMPGIKRDGTVLGFDVGARRIGVAVASAFGHGARALAVVDVHGHGPDWALIDRLHKEWRPDGLIVGDPMTLEGGDQPIRARAHAFARELQARYGLPVALGCAGWGAGQLEQELTENDWLTAPADAELLFSLPLDHRWEAAAGRIGVDFAHLADYAGHA